MRIKGHFERLPRQKKQVCLLYAATTCIALTLYLLTIAPGVLWQDSGGLQLRIAQNRILLDPFGLVRVHPFYVALSRVVGQFVDHQWAYAANLVSAFADALTLANIAVILFIWTGDLWATYVGVTSLMLAHTFWSLFVMAEVYTVQTFLSTISVLLLVLYLKTHASRYAIAALAISGFSLLNHQLALIDLAAFVLVLMWRMLMARDVPVKTAITFVGATVIGVVPFAGLVSYFGLRENITFMEALTGSLVGSFGDQVFGVSSLFKATSALYAAAYMLLNFPSPAVLLGLIGYSVMMGYPAGSVVLIITLLNFVFAYRYRVADQYTFFILVYTYWALATGVAVARLRALRVDRSRLTWAIVGMSLLVLVMPVTIYNALPYVFANHSAQLGLRIELGQVLPYRENAAYFLQPWKQGETSATRYAHEVFADLPHGSVVAGSTTALYPVKYVQIAENARPDLQIVVYPDDVLTAFGGEATREAVLRLVASRRLFVTSTGKPPYVPGWLPDELTRQPYGVVYQVVGDAR